MVMSLEKYKIHGKISESLQRWCGRKDKVAEETGYDIRYIESVMKYQVKKRKYEESERQTARSVAEFIYEKLSMYHESNIRFLDDMIERYHDRTQMRASACHEAPVEPVKPGQVNPHGETITHEYFCLVCGCGCNVMEIDRTAIADTVMKLLEERRKEFNHIIEGAKKLGFVVHDEQIPPIQMGQIASQQSTIVIYDGTGKKQVLLSDFGKLDPMDAERVIKSIETRLIEDEEAKQEVINVKRERDRQRERTAGQSGGAGVQGAPEGRSGSVREVSEGSKTAGAEAEKKV